MDSVRGVFDVDVAGERRTLVCDMQAAQILFGEVGPHWYLWLVERFIGKPVTLPDGTKGRQCEVLEPKDLVTALYGMLAADRAASGRPETPHTLMRSLSPFAFPELQQALTKAVIASLGVPGEVKGVDAGAAGAAPGNERAATHGTGAQS